MSESSHQIALFRWAAVAEATRPELALLYSVPNGGARHKATAGRLKAEGVRAGVPDVCLPVPRGGFGALYIELKAPREPGSTKRAGRLSQAQADFGAALLRAGNDWRVAYGWDEARRQIEGYLG